MKTPVVAANLTLLSSPAGKSASGRSADGSMMMLTEIQDEEFLHLPPVHQPPRFHSSYTVRRTSSSRSQYPIKPDYVLHVKKATTSGSLRDIHEESMDTGTSSSTTSNQTEKNHPNETSTCHTSSTPTQAKVLVGQEDRQRHRCVPRNTVPRQPCLYRVDPYNPQPDKYPAFLKAASQRDFFAEERDDYLPTIAHGRTHPTELRNRSMSVTSFLPKIAPPLNVIRTKSSSQPDISRHSCLVSPQSINTPLQSRKQRAQKLWQRAGQMLRLPRDDAEDDVTWVQAPSVGIFRPDYLRWPQRRHALAEPERMCMSQTTRERIMKDVEIRKRSMKRRVSKFLTIKLGLNTEEDLIA